MAGTPEITPVVASRDKACGRLPVATEYVRAGDPVAATAKLPAVPAVKVAASEPVNTGAVGGAIGGKGVSTG